MLSNHSSQAPNKKEIPKVQLVNLTLQTPYFLEKSQEHTCLCRHSASLQRCKAFTYATHVKASPYTTSTDKRTIQEHYCHLGHMVWVFGKKMEDDKEHWDIGCDAPLRRLSPHLAVISGIPGASTYPVRPHLPQLRGRTSHLHTQTHTFCTLVLYIGESSPQL